LSQAPKDRVRIKNLDIKNVNKLNCVSHPKNTSRVVIVFSGGGGSAQYEWLSYFEAG